MNPLIHSWLLQSAMIFLFIGSVAGMLVGGLLLFRPQRYDLLGAWLNRWISTRSWDKTMERSFSCDPWLYRHRRLSGIAILFGALFVLFYFTLQLDRNAAIDGLARHFHYYPALLGGLLDALVLSALAGAIFAAFIALCMIFRPSLLRGFEESANQWLSLRRALKPLEIPRDTLNDYVQHHARQVGFLLLLGGLYALVGLIYAMARIG